MLLDKPAYVRGSGSLLTWKTSLENTLQHSFAAQNVEDGPVGKTTIWEYARMAARAEERILELLDKSLHQDLAETRANHDVRTTARLRQGSRSSG